MEIWQYWWIYCLIALGFFFLILIISYIMSLHYIRAEERYIASNALDPNYLDPDVLEPTYLEPNNLYAPVVEIRKKYALWSKLATRTYIGIVLICAATGLGTQFLPSPFWLGFLLIACIFGAAFFVYRSWRK